MITTLLVLINTTLQVVTNSPSFWDSIASNPLYIVLTILGSAASIIALVLMYKKILLPYKWRKNYRENIPEDLRKAYLKNKIYLQPYITTTPPQASHEPKNTKLGNKELLRDYFINKVFIKESDENNTVFFLFGDSGTGKTAALVHLFDDYINKHNAYNIPFNIRLISLRREDALIDIKSIPKEERKKIILLLDAMDETPEVNDPTQLDSFLNTLKADFSDFARIVITCRPQFFPNDVKQELITHPQGIRTSTGFLECSIKYLAPFDDNQVQEYLDQAIAFRSEDPRRRRAEEIVNLQPAIAIRPLVLSFIKDIVDANRPINTTLDLFDTIIYSILKQDIKKTLGQKNLEEKITQWWEASSNVASYMYRHNRLTITDTELEKILPPDIEKQFKQRSLLTRYGGEFHFSHKSFYEYFMAYRFFLHYGEIKQVYGMDFALKLFDELYDSYCNKQSLRFANFQKYTNPSVASSLFKIGNGLYKINHFTQAEPKYNEALKIRRELAKDDPETYLPYVANTLNNLANLHRVTNRIQAAEKEYNEALNIRHELEKDNPNTYRPKIAQTLNNLAILHRKTNRRQEAEKECKEALNIRLQLAEQSPDAYLPSVAQSLNNLAYLYKDMKRYQEAEVEYNKALDIRRQLAEKKSDAFLPDLAQTLNNLAVLHKDTNRHQNAEAEYNEALNIRRQLATNNPDAYLPYVANTLNNLAILHKNTNCHKEAEAEYNEALNIRRQLAKNNPDAYLPKVAMTLNNLGNFHRVTNRHKKAESEYNEALTIRRQLADNNPDAYLPDVAGTLYNFALLHIAQENLPAAEAAALESLEKYRIMAEKSPAAFEQKVERGEKLLEEIRQKMKKNK